MYVNISSDIHYFPDNKAIYYQVYILPIYFFRGFEMNYTFNFKPKSYPDPGYYKVKPEPVKVRTSSNDNSNRRKLIRELSPEDISLSVGVPIS